MLYDCFFFLFCSVFKIPKNATNTLTASVLFLSFEWKGSRNQASINLSDRKMLNWCDDSFQCLEKSSLETRFFFFFFLSLGRVQILLWHDQPALDEEPKHKVFFGSVLQRCTASWSSFMLHIMQHKLQILNTVDELLYVNGQSWKVREGEFSRI